MPKAKVRKAEPVPQPNMIDQIRTLPLYCSCCADSDQSKIIRKRKPAGPVDDEPWMILGLDGQWRPIRTCPWCRVSLG